MRTAGLFLTIVGFGALTVGLRSAGEPSDQAREPAPSERRAQPTSDRPSDEGRGVRPRAGREREDGKDLTGKQRVSGAAEKGGGARLKPAQPGVWRPDQKPAGMGQAKSVARANFHPPAWNKSVGAEKEGVTPQRAEPLHTQPVLFPILKTAAKPSLPVAPSPVRGAAAIGGPTFSPVKNSGVLNGTGMKHKS